MIGLGKEGGGIIQSGGRGIGLPPPPPPLLLKEARYNFLEHAHFL